MQFNFQSIDAMTMAIANMATAKAMPAKHTADEPSIHVQLLGMLCHCVPLCQDGRALR